MAWAFVRKKEGSHSGKSMQRKNSIPFLSHIRGDKEAVPLHQFKSEKNPVVSVDLHDYEAPRDRKEELTVASATVSSPR